MFNLNGVYFKNLNTNNDNNNDNNINVTNSLNSLPIQNLFFNLSPNQGNYLATTKTIKLKNKFKPKNKQKRKNNEEIDREFKRQKTNLLNIKPIFNVSQLETKDNDLIFMVEETHPLSQVKGEESGGEDQTQENNPLINEVIERLIVLTLN